MGFRPLRRAPMMLGGVGFQAGLDEARREVAPVEARPETDTVTQLERLKSLLDDGVLTPDEFERAKRRVLAG